MMNSFVPRLSLAGRTYYFANNVMWALLSLIDNILSQAENDGVPGRYQVWIQPSFHLANFLADERFYPEDTEQVPGEESTLLDALYIEVADIIAATWGDYFAQVAESLESTFPHTEKGLWLEAVVYLGLMRLLEAYDLLMRESALHEPAYYHRYLANYTTFENLKASLSGAILNAPWDDTQDPSMMKARQWAQSQIDELVNKWTRTIEELVRNLRLAQ